MNEHVWLDGMRTHTTTHNNTYMRYYIFCIMALDDGIPDGKTTHTHEETGVTHKHKNGDKPHQHEEKGCKCKDSRVLDCSEHGDKN